MKRHVLIILFGLILVSQNKTFAICQEIETIQTETKQLTDKEEKRLKKQQEKEKKARLKEEKKQQRIEEKILLKEDEKKKEELKNELKEQKKNSKNNNNDSTDGHEIDTSSNIEKDYDENLTKDQVDNPSQNELKRNIQKQEKTTKQEPKKYNNLSIKEKTSIWVVVIGIIFLWITRSRYKKKCYSCKKWNAMKKISTKCIDEKPSVIYKKREIKNSKGEVLKTWTDSVPATIYYYQIHRKCKHCGHEDYLSKSDKREN